MWGTRAQLWRPRTNGEGLNLPQPCLSSATRVPPCTDMRSHEEPPTHHTLPPSSASVQLPVTFQVPANAKSLLTDPSKSKMALSYSELALNQTWAGKHQDFVSLCSYLFLWLLFPLTYINDLCDGFMRTGCDCPRLLALTWVSTSVPSV